VTERVLAHGLDLAAPLRDVVERGAAFVPSALDEGFRRRLQAEIEDGSFEPAPDEVGPVRQATEAFTIRHPTEGYPMSEALGRAALSAIRAQGEGIRGLATYRPNEFTVQRYRPGPVGISPHLDGKRFRRLVAVFTTEGSAPFAICAERAGPAIAQWIAEPGSLVLLRAPGLAGRRDGRPFHTVGAPDEGMRYSVAFRMNARSQ
jgi:hypothetical protein